MTNFPITNIDRHVYLTEKKDAICIDYTFKLFGLVFYHKLNTNGLPVDVDAVIKDTAKAKVGFNT